MQTEIAKTINKYAAGFALLFLAAILTVRAAEPAIIPQPQKMVVKDGVFEPNAKTEILAWRETGSEAQKLAAILRSATGLHISVTAAVKTKIQPVVTIISLEVDQTLSGQLGTEGYTLSVRPKSVNIRAASGAGLFYGIQTLLQLLSPEIYSTNKVSGVKWTIPCVEITDAPRFGWRGLMLDVSRHFFTKQEVEKLLDAMALHKLNTFHWHLVDNNGWRIEIKKYPKLTQVGAWRDGIEHGLDPKSSTAYGPDGRYGGFYTQDDIREVVAYAAKLHITVVPEIEMPGHSAAALRAYPEFSCSGTPGADVYCAGNEMVFEFLQDVLTEVFDLFPGKYIHIGGDEVNKDNWKECGQCQARIKSEGLKSTQELQSYFIRRMEKFFNAHGKTLIGWSEILQGGLAQNATVMDWIGGGREAANQGHDVVMSPVPYCYFDARQSSDASAEPGAIGYSPLRLAKVYSFEPIPLGLALEKQKHILGAQGNIWTEYIPNLKHVEYMAFPRLSALAEVTWSPKDSRNYDDFLRRLKVDEKRLDQLGVNYRSSALGDGLPGIKVGDWEPATISTELTPMDWDVTRKVTAAGKAIVNFDYTEGAHGLDIAWAALLEDGKEISRDTHDGFTGGKPRKPAYTLDVPSPKPGAKYTLRALVAGNGGANSRGNVLWNFKPANK
jgi:hexosaminidase